MDSDNLDVSRHVTSSLFQLSATMLCVNFFMTSVHQFKLNEKQNLANFWSYFCELKLEWIGSSKALKRNESRPLAGLPMAL